MHQIVTIILFDQLKEAVVSAADVHKRALDDAAAASLKSAPPPQWPFTLRLSLAVFHNASVTPTASSRFRYITEVFSERSNAFAAIIESRLSRAAAVANAGA